MHTDYKSVIIVNLFSFLVIKAMNVLLIIILLVIAITLIYYTYTKYYNKTIIVEKNDSKFDNRLILDLNLPINEFTNLNDTYKFQYNNLDVDYYRDFIEHEIDEIPFLQEEIELIQDNRNLRELPNNEILQLGNIIHQNDDPQSVHDTYIQKKTKKDYTFQGFSPDANLNKDLKDYITQNNLYNPKETSKILQIVNDIKQRNSHITNYNTTEYNILNDIFYNYNDDNIKQQLLKEILDCKGQYNALYCPTGVSTRLVESIYINNPMDSPKTKYILNQEILNKAAQLKEKNLSLDSDKFKQKLINTLQDDYKDIMTKDEINDSVKDWIDYI